MRTIGEIFPDYQTVLELQPAELGAVVLELWDKNHDGEDLCTLSTFSHEMYGPTAVASYPGGTRTNFERVLAEAWNWLQREGLIVQDPHQSASWFRRTRRGKELKTRADVAAYRHAGSLPRPLLHPIIDGKTWPLFLRGDYDVAVFQAFKTVEVAVRQACGYPDEAIGAVMMRKAFSPEGGPLSDMNVLPAEREGLASLFAGAIGHAKNPQSHRDHPVEMEEAAQLLIFASYLMSIVDRRALSRREANGQ